MTIQIADCNEFHPLVNGKAYSTFSEVVILRVTYSNTHVDTAFALSVAQSEQLAVRGFYAYVTASVDASAQGVFFAKSLLAHTKFRANDFISWDIEEGVGDQGPRARAFLNGVHSVLGEKLDQDFGYSGLSFWSAHLGNLVKEGVVVHKWIAAYGQGRPNVDESLWQDTDKANVPGVSGPCDCSVFNGTLSEFINLINPPIVKPEPQPTPIPPVPSNTKEKDMTSYIIGATQHIFAYHEADRTCDHWWFDSSAASPKWNHEVLK